MWGQPPSAVRRAKLGRVCAAAMTHVARAPPPANCRSQTATCHFQRGMIRLSKLSARSRACPELPKGTCFSRPLSRFSKAGYHRPRRQRTTNRPFRIPVSGRLPTKRNYFSRTHPPTRKLTGSISNFPKSGGAPSSAIFVSPKSQLRAGALDVHRRP